MADIDYPDMLPGETVIFDSEGPTYAKDMPASKSVSLRPELDPRE